MITSGFFESINSDRTYTSDSFNTFFEGIIPANGVFERVDSGLKVTNGDGMTVQIAPGKGIVNNHWIRNTAIHTMQLSTASATYNRYDAIVLRWKKADRTVIIEVVKGSENSNEPKPQPTRNDSIHELIIAYIYIPASSTKVTASNVTDMRYDNDACGLITNLIDQVDISNLYRRYSEAFNELQVQMQSWQNNAITAYNEWFANLTGNLIVDTKLTRKTAIYTTYREDGTQYIDVPDGLQFKNGDFLDIYINGVHLTQNLDYKLMMNEVENIPMIYIYSDIDPGVDVTFICTKCDVGNMSNELDGVIDYQMQFIDIADTQEGGE